MTTGRYAAIPPPLSTPLPRQIARETAAMMSGETHRCLYDDSGILFDDLRETRKRRSAVIAFVATAIIGSLAGLVLWIYGIGEDVGTARTEMGYLQRAEADDRDRISKCAEDLRDMERDSASRYSEIEQILIRLDSRLENIESSLRKRGAR